MCVLEDFEGGDVGVFGGFVGGVVDIVVVLVECEVVGSLVNGCSELGVQSRRAGTLSSDR